MIDFKTIADNADLIINGYAFTKSGDYIRVLNLNRPNKALVFDYNQEVIETSMDDIEIQIVIDYYNKNKKYMEVEPCLNIMNLKYAVTISIIPHIVLLRLCMSMQVIRNLLNLVQLSFLLKVTVTQLLKDRESSLKEK